MRGAALWTLAVQFFIAQIVAQAAWRTPYSLSTNYISDLGHTACGFDPPGSSNYICSPWHSVMNLSFGFLGLTIVAGLPFARNAFSVGRKRAIGFFLLVCAGVGLIAVGVFTENENGLWHRVGAAGHFVLGNLGLVFLGLALRRDSIRRWLPAYSVVSGLVGVTATGLFIRGFYFGLGVGGMERLAAYPLPLWLTVMGLTGKRTGKRDSEGVYPTE